MAVDLSGSYSLPPHLAEVARRELNETPATRAECLRQLRRRLRRSSLDSETYSEEDESEEGERDGVEIPDDRFLLRFLRSKKFDVRRSQAMYERYMQFFCDNPSMAAGLNPHAVRHVWDAGVLGGLRDRDRRGRSVMVAFPGRWDPAAHTLEDVLRAMILQLEHMTLSEDTQVNGIVLVADFTNFSLYHVRCLKPWYFQTMATLVQNAFPARFKGVYVVNQPWYISFPLSLLKPFLSEKMKKRINLLGANLKALKERFWAEMLPEEFGGLQSPYSGSEWAETVIESHERCSSPAHWGYRTEEEQALREHSSSHSSETFCSAD